MASFLALLSISLVFWHILSTLVLSSLIPNAAADLQSRTGGKYLQYFLLLGLWGIVLPIAHFSKRKLKEFDKPDSSKYQTAPARGKIRGILEIAALVLTCLLLVVLVRNQNTGLTFDLYHDGPHLAATNEYLMGGTPYRDIFIHYGPLHDIFAPLAAFKIAGLTYGADHRFWSWMSGVGTALLLVGAHQILRTRWLLWLFAVILILRTNLFIPDRVVPSLVAMCLYVASLRRKDGNSPGGLLLSVGSGFFVVVSILYSLEIGATLLLGLTAALGIGLFFDGSRENRRRCRSVGTGALAAASIFLIYLLATGGFPNYIKDAWWMATTRMPTWSDGHLSHVFHFRFLESWQAFRTHVLINGVPFFCAGMWAYLAFKAMAGKVDAWWHQVLAITSVLFFQFFIYVGRSDFIHWKNSTSLHWILLIVILDEIWRTFRRNRQRDVLSRVRSATFVTLLGAPLLALLLGNNAVIFLLWNRFGQKPDRVAPFEMTAAHKLLPRLGEMPVPAHKEKEVASVAAWIERTVPPDGFFFDFTNYGGYYFLTGKRNPTRFGLVNYVHGPAMTAECLGDLVKNAPQAVLVERNESGLIFRKDLQPIADFIETNYEARHQINRMAVYVPKKGKP